MLPLYSSESNETKISVPKYSGGLYGDLTWYYLRPTASDGDLQYGTFLTLTDNPANLTAHVLELEPDYNHSFRVNLGYQIPDNVYNVNANYFYYHSSDSEKIQQKTLNQFIQNFLGASYKRAWGKEHQNLHQLDGTLGAHLIIDKRLDIHPNVGLRYVDVSQKLHVGFNDLFFNPFPISAALKGTEKSHYWGIGPVVDTLFKYTIYKGLSLTGHLGASALIGNISSKVHSDSTQDNLEQSFKARDSHCRVVPVINTGLAFTYTHPFNKSSYGLEFTIGYEVDHYFDIIDRINPFNGYVNNSNTKPVRTSSHLGLGGPYARISLIQNPLPASLTPRLTSLPNDAASIPGCFLRMTNEWLKPSPSEHDLTYAFLQKNNDSREREEVSPGYHWSGSYDFGYRFPFNLDIWGRYFHYHATDSSSATAKVNKEISSVNASGPAFVSFSNARSRIKYHLNQADLLVGKYVQLGQYVNLHPFLGIRYLSLERSANNNYSGGLPPLTTQNKSPKLKSDYWGIGLIFGIDPKIMFIHSFGLIGHFDTGLLMGNIKSKIDQNNRGSLGDSSNTLRQDSRQAIVPIIDAKGGVTYSCALKKHFVFNIEAGYQFSGYYKAVNQIFPTLLTGLEQTNSNLILTGPYFTVGLTGSF